MDVIILYLLQSTNINTAKSRKKDPTSINDLLGRLINTNQDMVTVIIKIKSGNRDLVALGLVPKMPVGEPTHHISVWAQSVALASDFNCLLMQTLAGSR